MATTRPTKVPTNLKERIAALEQRNATSAPTSPTTSAAPTVANTAQSVGALKDKIAKFERKGGVPVPRGSFGLGAPPVAEGPKRQGELYANRMQTGRALTPQYTGGSLASIGSYANPSQRRSFSASILTGDFDDNYLDYTPISTPTSIASPLSPDYTGQSPEVSPSRSTNGDIPAVRRNATRGTSFHEALEFARKVEAAKKEASLPPAKKKSADSANTNGAIENSTTIPVTPLNEEAKELLDPTPAIFVSSDDVVGHESASPAVDDFPLQSSGMIDSPVVEHLTPEVAEVNPPLDGPEMKPDMSLVKPTIVSDTQLATKAESVKGPSTSSKIDDASVGTIPVPIQSPPSVPIPKVAEPTQISSPLPPRLEVRRSGTRERGSSSESGESRPSAIQTPQIAPDDTQSAPILVGSFEVKINAAESKLPGDRKYVSVDTEALVSAPKDIDISTGSNNAVPIEVSAPATDKVDEVPLRTRSQIPTPRGRPTIQPPDPSSFLSPPPSGIRTSQISSGASLSSGSSVISLPVSMAEMSPTEVSRALKMTPATGRGIPVFLPPSNSQTRKSDFVYLPTTPVDNLNFGAGLDVEEPSVGLGHYKAGSASDLPSNTFKAVVHGKVKETPASATLPRQVMPQTPKNIKRATILQNPLSPGQGELAALLQEAMLLEDTLNKGELPGESPKAEPVNVEADASSKILAAAKLKEEERQRIAHANVQLRAKRDMPTHGRLKHTFLMPLSKARASQKQEVPTPVEQAAPRSSPEDSRPKGNVSDHVGGKDVDHEKPPSIVGQSSPSKIPKLSKFPSFKRFGSISRTAAQQGAVLRHSNSTSSEISSEDSNLIVTPPDNALELGERKRTNKDVDQQSTHSQTLSFSFPSLSPKKAGSIGRAASFAEKMWSRARTKSNGSVFSSTSGITHQSNEELTPQLPVLSELPSLPSLGSIVPTLTEKDSLLHRPASGSSLRNRVDFSGPLQHLSVSNTDQPLSPMSMSSIGSLPSPLFDKDICDAFPSVPTDTPTILPNRYHPRGRGQGLTAAATAASADFDSALLSSAIHLAARNKASASSDYTVPATSDQPR